MEFGAFLVVAVVGLIIVLTLFWLAYNGDEGLAQFICFIAALTASAILMGLLANGFNTIAHAK